MSLLLHHASRQRTRELAQHTDVARGGGVDGVGAAVVRLVDVMMLMMKRRDKASKIEWPCSHSSRPRHKPKADAQDVWLPHTGATASTESR